MFGDLIKAGAKAMGGARFGLLNVLPGALLVTVTTVLARAHAYDLDRPVDLGDVLPDEAGTGAVLGFALAALVGGILLRPFERVLVQQVEGYWDAPSPLARLRGAAVELHRRRRDNAAARIQLVEWKPLEFQHGVSTLRSLSDQERRMRRRERALTRDERIVDGYPDDKTTSAAEQRIHRSELMPTRLGNVLRRGERLAGDRYGLDSMVAYPRIYPYVSERLAEAMARNLELLTTTVSLSVSFGLLSAITLPLLVRLDLWSLVPLAAFGLSVLAYRGALITAAYAGTVFSTVFDVHRFDLAAAMRYALPRTAAEEFELNQSLTRYLSKAESHTLQDDAELQDKRFSHPEGSPPPPGQPLIPPPGDGDASA
ncbi:hypothetical protein ACFY9X_25095 [Streptomyces nigra]|jgi:hypothetical protein|uniref:hypothetical protein n=1 Tax=Streptomyces nigra TaxID=1827580 RepID=UPI0036E5B50C